ncbi:MAG: DMT family transporter [Deferrisomatales bacterium]|nr:DMT family transporter [Deferrisomatales bacterium]
MQTRKRRLFAEFLLATVTVFWGATFPVVKEAVTLVPVLCFLWVRFALAAVLLALLAGRQLRTLDRRGIQRGVLLGLLLFLSYLFQTFGLEVTSASNAGFLTGLNVVWVPLLAGPLLGKPAAPGARAGVVLAVLGLLTLTWHWPWRLALGDALVVICSVFVALHILGLDSLTAGYDGRALATVQVATMAVLGLLGSLVFEPVTWPRAWPAALVWALVVTAVFATVYAFWIMTTFQRWTTPTRAALVYTLEPVFAALFAVLLANEVLGLGALVGGALVVAGMVVAQVWPARPGAARQTSPPAAG